MPSLARRKARGAGQRFAGCDHLEPAAHFIGDGVFLFEVPLPQRGEPVRAHAGLRKPRDVFGKRNGVRARLAFRHQTVGEAHAQRFFAADRAAGENEVHRLRMPDQPGKADGAEIDQRHAEAAAIDAEDRILGDHAQIGPQRQLHAAGHRKTFHRGDHRFGQPQPARPHRRDGRVAADLALLAGIACRHRLQIGAGAKISAGAGEHRDRRAVIGVEGEKRIEQFSRGQAIDGVAAMRAIDGDDGDGAVAFDEDGVGIGHIRRSTIVLGCSPLHHPARNGVVKIKGLGTVLCVLRYLNPAFCSARFGATLNAFGSQNSRFSFSRSK